MQRPRHNIELQAAWTARFVADRDKGRPMFALLNPDPYDRQQPGSHH